MNPSDTHGSLVLRRRGPRIWKVIARAVMYLLVITTSILIGFPFFQMFSTSFKPLNEVYSIPMTIFPKVWDWRNYAEAWTLVPFGRFVVNSLIYTVFLTLGEVSLGTMSGYAFGRLRFPHRERIFFMVLLTMMIPGTITLIPRFILLADLGWVDTYQGLIVPVLSSTFATFLLRQYFRSLPDEIFDSAKIDGAGHVRQLVQIALPMSKPILATLLLLATVAHWNAYQWPLIVTNSEKMRTLPVGLVRLRSVVFPQHWGVIMSGAVMVVLPLLVLFFIMQRQFIEGATRGALKG